MCVLWGDPHVNVFDNFRLQKVGRGANVLIADHGDFWLVKHSQIQIQGRYWSSNTNGASSLRALAISGPFLQNHTFIVQAMDGRISWDGKEVLDRLPSRFSRKGLLDVKFHAGGRRADDNLDHLSLRTVDAVLPLGIKVTINRWPTHIDAMISMPRPQGDMDGHCGNWNHDPSDDTAAAFRQRLGGQVPKEMNLFTRKSFEHVGCFMDRIGDRDLIMRKGALMKREECALACADFAYFGRQWKGECFCGTAYGKHGELPASACACDADDIGVNRNCVYRYEGEALLPIAPVVFEKTVEEDCEPSRRTRAQDLCQKAVEETGGIQTEDFLKGCIFDVCFGDETFATAGAAMQSQMIGRAVEIESQIEASAGEGHVHPNMKFDLSVGQGPIHWATHPEMCIGLDSSVRDVRNGARLQLGACEGDEAVDFLSPAEGGEGMLRLAADPSFCVDVPRGIAKKGHKMQVWKCNENHPNMVFALPSAGSPGPVRWSAHPEFCLDVDAGRQSVGTSIQLWTC